MSDKKKFNWLPEKQDAEHTRLNDLARIRGHQYYFGNLITGKITYRKGDDKIATGLTNIMAAKSFVEKELIARATGKSVEAVTRQMAGITNPLFKDCFTEAVKQKEVGKEDSTKKGYWKSWNHGLEFFWGDKTAADCNKPNIIDDYKKAYLQHCPTRSFHHTGVHLGMTFKYMIKNGYLTKMPDMTPLKDIDEIVRKKKKWKKPGRVYSAKEIKALLSAADDLKNQGKTSWTCSMDHKEMLSTRALLGINLGLSGLRMKEAMALLWEKIDYKNKIIHVWSFKNHKWREVPMNKTLEKLFLKQQTFTGHSRFVFPMPTNPDRFISNQVFDKVWYRVKEISQIKDWNIEDAARFHDLRHTAASKMADIGMPHKAACDTLDMSLDEFDKTYAKASGKTKAIWMNKIDWGKD